MCILRASHTCISLREPPPSERKSTMSTRWLASAMADQPCLLNKGSTHTYYRPYEPATYIALARVLVGFHPIPCRTSPVGLCICASQMDRMSSVSPVNCIRVASRHDGHENARRLGETLLISDVCNSPAMAFDGRVAAGLIFLFQRLGIRLGIGTIGDGVLSSWEYHTPQACVM